MKILLIEDQIDKIETIKNFISTKLKEGHFEFILANNLMDARRKILSTIYDLIIFDLFLPINDDPNTPLTNISDDILNEFIESNNYQTEAIAITAYDIDEIKNITCFNDAGVTVVHYSEDDSKWKNNLEIRIRRAFIKLKYDFLIFCALQKERAAYSETDAEILSLKNLKGLDCQKIKIGDYNGLCITPARMGLVSMAITATKAIESFQPKIVAMSGICAGMQEKSNLLDIIIGDMCWEYQTGKWKDNEFKQEPYQASIPSDLETELKQFILDELNVNKIKDGLCETELKNSKIFLGPISSGSAVISSDKKMLDISAQHRKMAGLEMEMYSMYEAARQSLTKPLFFGAKTVVDLGNEEKDDSLQESGCILSARLVVEYLKIKLPKLFN